MSGEDGEGGRPRGRTGDGAAVREPGAVETPREPGAETPRGPGLVETVREPGAVEAPHEPGAAETLRGPGPVETVREPGTMETPHGPGATKTPRGPGPVEAPQGPAPVEAPPEPGPVEALRGRSVPVVIVGAGPVGVTTALLLARYGVRSVVLERHRDVYPLPRAVATDDEVCRILQAVGVYESFAAVSRPARGLRLLDAGHGVIAEFRRTERGAHGFAQTRMFDQPVLERLLRDALADRREAELWGGVEVVSVQEEEGGSRVRFRDAAGRAGEVRASYVLACDGAGSPLREACGIGFEDLRFEESWTVLDVRTPAAVRTWEGVDQVCDPRRPATFMRIGEDRYRWEFRLGADEDPDEAGVRALVAPWVEPAPGEEFEVLRTARYTFRARLAERWRHGRVFLLGDAAHQTPPFVGQGLCAGMRDAANLSWKLARVLGGGADERLLDTYESERRPHARKLILAAVATGWAMTGGQDRAAALRRAAVGAVCRVPGVTRLAGNGLAPPLRRGVLSAGRLGGRFCPQPGMRDGTFDDVLGPSFALVSGAPALTPALRPLAAALGARLVPAHGLGDGGALAAWLRAGGADAVLVRPDRVVLDAVPRGGREFAGIAGWAPLLRTGRAARTDVDARAPSPAEPFSPLR
ncbi:bifunctional 3-(3-hydroxy-phenyl)propionate/3-hydroxycinnamic acid hydroxylase MhpA [Streptomyces evansiae]|uniref:bifunctional 3-(3-hydroxy-phenyl)propionate/3-hydroxycinnamic acid hydroxylase MhpA n=1 Tax=Streptomyces evansiae TaxID=3075535 RepID=UPI002888643F|nr:bifunctional 3-(3-hydroxy-phenyl)propionate/3-hydroxycinnamic acid hydroxylase [Streptomyces sp. DSM 41859]MDT0423490.1 bifunctional 3-(3-hydroxy-phenyl)propionate/3-hydroxycinnamic acid hydroxylase [Streptomyces sp. DSM 41859]